jgi:hypothetical protein
MTPDLIRSGSETVGDAVLALLQFVDQLDPAKIRRPPPTSTIFVKLEKSCAAVRGGVLIIEHAEWPTETEAANLQTARPLAMATAAYGQSCAPLQCAIA